MLRDNLLMQGISIPFLRYPNVIRVVEIIYFNPNVCVFSNHLLDVELFCCKNLEWPLLFVAYYFSSSYSSAFQVRKQFKDIFCQMGWVFYHFLIILYYRGIVIFNIVVTDLKRCQQTTSWRAGIIISLRYLNHFLYYLSKHLLQFANLSAFFHNLI